MRIFRATARPQGKDPHRLEVTYTIAEGPKVIVDSVVTLGAKNTRQSLIDKDSVSYTPRLPCGRTICLRLKDVLHTRNFDWAEIDPRRQITTQTDEDVLVKLHEAKRNDIRYGFGFEVVNRGGSIPSGTVALPGIPPVGLPVILQDEPENLLGTTRDVPIRQAQLSRLGPNIDIRGAGGRAWSRRGSASYVNPHFVGTDWGSNLTISASETARNPIFTARFGDFSYQLERSLNATATKNSFASLRLPPGDPYKLNNPGSRGARRSSCATLHALHYLHPPIRATMRWTRTKACIKPSRWRSIQKRSGRT